MKRYRPTPEGLRRDVGIVLHVLAIARANLDHYYPISTTTESTSAGTCYDDEPQKAST